uniref:Uncharacterized protein n=1 Tax=Pithovirus LCPAC401 TaxID=2506595 RepID=A0A481ZAR0_9VIRU|nr:MAG: hypothetical protein LCPAC401_03540 [Pithovirus LCPAC401]
MGAKSKTNAAGNTTTVVIKTTTSAARRRRNVTIKGSVGNMTNAVLRRNTTRSVTVLTATSMLSA